VTPNDLVAISHHHADHYGGMEAVIRAFCPRLFLATNSSHTTPHYLSLLRLVRDSGMQAVSPKDSTRKINLGSVMLTVLPQPPEDKAEENDNSIGLRVQYGDFSALLTGDSEALRRAAWPSRSPGSPARSAPSPRMGPPGGPAKPAKVHPGPGPSPFCGFCGWWG
jgi:competence protein ComEC